jgi:hypothetical protein
VIASYSKGVIDRVIDFGGKHVPACKKPDNQPESLKEAIKQFCGEKQNLENSVIHALNEFLVIEDVPGYVETGTIFARASDGAEPAEVYVCVTPACDLVPRQPIRKESWEHKLHPARAVIVLRAKMIDVGRDHLKKAEEGRSVFLQVVGKPKAILLVGDKPPVPTLEWLFLEDMGRITENKLRALEVGRPAVQPAPQGAGQAAPENPVALAPQNVQPPPLTFMPTEMVALGQIRAVYASRIFSTLDSILPGSVSILSAIPRNQRPRKNKACFPICPPLAWARTVPGTSGRGRPYLIILPGRPYQGLPGAWHRVPWRLWLAFPPVAVFVPGYSPVPLPIDFVP